MSFPVGVETVLVRWGRAFLAAGDGTSARLSVAPVFGGTSRVVWAATGDPLIGIEAARSTDAEGEVRLPAVDQPGWVDASGQPFSDWAYKATVSYKSAEGRTAREEWLFKVVQGQTEVDLDLIVSGVAGAPTVAPIAFVSSLGGLTGQVSVEDLEGLGIGGGVPESTIRGWDAATVADANEHAQTLVDGIVLPDWDTLDGKPTVFPPAEHRHPWSQIDDVPTVFPPALHYHSWVDIQEKPTTFAPSAHSHAISEVTGLDAALADKAAASHQHPASDITGLTKTSVGLGNVDNTSDANKPVSAAQQAALDGKAPTARALPAGGTTGQILTKTSSTDYAATWQNAPAADLPNTGVRLLTSNALAGTGQVRFQRVGPIVTITLGVGGFLRAQFVNNQTSGTLLDLLGLGGIPVGFRPASHLTGDMSEDGNFNPLGKIVAFPGADSAVLRLKLTTAVATTLFWRASVTFTTPDAWPTTLPGTPA